MVKSQLENLLKNQNVKKEFTNKKNQSVILTESQYIVYERGGTIVKSIDLDSITSVAYTREQEENKPGQFITLLSGVGVIISVFLTFISSIPTQFGHSMLAISFVGVLTGLLLMIFGGQKSEFSVIVKNNNSKLSTQFEDEKASKLIKYIQKYRD